MAKIKLTKNELKKQRDNLRRFTRYLPTLDLKKQQLIREIRDVQNNVDDLTARIEGADAATYPWVDLFAEEIDWEDLVRVVEVVTDQGNIAGIDIPIFRSIKLEEHSYDLMTMPLWVDTGLALLKDQLRRTAEVKVARQQLDILREELRTTIQRIKLFEEVKIPDAKKNIRTLQIFLGDQQTAETVRGKIAKSQLQRKRNAAKLAAEPLA